MSKDSEKLLKEKDDIINSIVSDWNALFNDEIGSVGRYIHHIFCNGNNRDPIGTPGKFCNCKKLPLFKRIRQQAYEEGYKAGQANISKPDFNVEMEYLRLLSKYSNETCMMSYTVTENDHYKEIVKLGLPVVPYLLRSIKDRDRGIWGCLSMFCEIINDHPDNILESERGRLDPICERYLEWAKLKGYEIAE